MLKKKVLIVDDDRDLRTALGARLRSQGYNVAFAADGVSAVSSARRESPDLILLDIGLPAGDGYVVMDRISALPDLAGIPVIVVSARDADANRAKSLGAGAVAYFEKPADNDELMESIASVTTA